MTQTTLIQNLGNLRAVRATFYTDNKKPALAPTEDQRSVFLTYKTNKKDNTLRSSIALIINKLPKHVVNQCDKGAEFIQALIDERQDELLKRCADKELTFEQCEDAQFLVTDYFDNTRTANGTRVTVEGLGKFFDDSMLAWVVERIVAKFPQFDSAKVEAIAKQYKQAFCDLAKYGLPHTKQVATLLQKLVSEFEWSEEQVELRDWTQERVKKLMDKHNASEMMIDAI